MSLAAAARRIDASLLRLATHAVRSAERRGSGKWTLMRETVSARLCLVAAVAGVALLEGVETFDAWYLVFSVILGVVHVTLWRLMNKLSRLDGDPTDIVPERRRIAKIVAERERTMPLTVLRWMAPALLAVVTVSFLGSVGTVRDLGVGILWSACFAFGVLHSYLDLVPPADVPVEGDGSPSSRPRSS